MKMPSVIHLIVGAVAILVALRLAETLINQPSSNQTVNASQVDFPSRSLRLVSNNHSSEVSDQTIDDESDDQTVTMFDDIKIGSLIGANDSSLYQLTELVSVFRIKGIMPDDHLIDGSKRPVDLIEPPTSQTDDLDDDQLLGLLIGEAINQIANPNLPAIVGPQTSPLTQLATDRALALLDPAFDQDINQSILVDQSISQISRITPDRATSDAAMESSNRAFDYEFDSRVGRGAFGEIWSARRISDGTLFVLKRMLTEPGMPANLRNELKHSFMREAYFGNLLNGLPNIVRFHDSFECRGQLWLVFSHEGVSTWQYFNEITQNGARTPSKQWAAMRMLESPTLLKAHLAEVNDSNLDLANGSILRSWLRSTLIGLSNSHAMGVTHRDIKPNNILIKLNPAHPNHADLDHHTPLFMKETVSENVDDDESMDVYVGEVRLADFGSGVMFIETDRNQALYARGYPSENEVSIDYAPPELLFSNERANPEAMMPIFSSPAYDSWSLGLTLLEIWLGGMDRALALDPRTAARVHAKLGQTDDRTKSKALKFRAFNEYCVYDPPDSTVDCNRKRMMSLYRAHDPFGLGFDDSPLLLDLIQQLMRWVPKDRMTPQEAIRHPYFQST